MEVFFWDGAREMSCHGLWASPFKAIMFSFSQRTVVACQSLLIAISALSLTSSLRWDAHITHLISRGHRLFAQSTSWAHSEGLPTSFTHFLLTTYVLPSATFGAEFIGDCNAKSRAVGLCTTTMRTSSPWMGIGHAVRFGTL